MTQCCAPGCKNKGRHIFPKDTKRRKSWEKALRIKNFKATEHSALCSAHFKADDYFGQSKYNVYEPRAKFLKKTAVPSIFSFTKESISAKERLIIKRSLRKLILDVPTSLPTSSQENKETCLPMSSLSMGTKSYNEVGISAESEEISLSASPSEYVFFCKGTKVDIEHRLFKAIQFYTGFESYKKFYFVYSTLMPVAHKINYFGRKVINHQPLLSTEYWFFSMLIKLRKNKCIFELSRFFNISTTC